MSEPEDARHLVAGRLATDYLLRAAEGVNLTLDGDLTSEFGGVTLTVDRMSAPYIQGATIDFVDTIEKQGFTIDNPNATGSCACGDSFN